MKYKALMILILLIIILLFVVTIIFMTNVFMLIGDIALYSGEFLAKTLRGIL